MWTQRECLPLNMTKAYCNTTTLSAKNFFLPKWNDSCLTSSRSCARVFFESNLFLLRLMRLRYVWATRAMQILIVASLELIKEWSNESTDQPNERLNKKKTIVRFLVWLMNHLMSTAERLTVEVFISLLLATSTWISSLTWLALHTLIMSCRCSWFHFGHHVHRQLCRLLLHTWKPPNSNWHFFDVVFIKRCFLSFFRRNHIVSSLAANDLWFWSVFFIVCKWLCIA